MMNIVLQMQYKILNQKLKIFIKKWNNFNKDNI